MDKSAFEALAQEHYLRLWGAAVALVGSRHDADDLVQETFLQAASSWRGRRGDSSPGTWLYAIFLNQHRRWRRRKARQKGLWQRWLARENRGELAASAESELESQEWRASLWRLAESLPEPQREALALRYSAELSYEEIAQAQGCPVGTVKSRLHHALAALREALEKENPDCCHVCR